MTRLLLALLPSLASDVIAQTITPSITGFVKDQSDASVPRATVTAIQEATGFSRSVETLEDGTFSLLALPMGTYTFTAGNRVLLVREGEGTR
ncbi:MAG: carboxypeptidase-like regulatory domain-containing protein [Acidobacteria bacterium]|nr:carboxypeptidase-like regulatory domain-containing protein [Acidobacteriota bacterium]